MASCIRANVDITIVEGGTFDQTFQWKQGTPLAAVDITGYTAEMKIRATLAGAVLLSVPNQVAAWTADAATGIYTSGIAASGQWRVYLRDESTLGLCAANKDINGVYDLFLTNVSDEVVFQMYGSALISAAVTR
jgi:hypothetical protein